MKYLYLSPIGTVEEELIAALETSLWHAFGFEVRRMPAIDAPGSAYDRQRNQYSSTVFLRFLLQQCPADAARVLALTEHDLFIPMLSFIYGQAQLQGSTAIVSVARLRQEFYTLPPNRMLLLTRLIKESFHELGHTFGLTHCLDRTCPMSLATNIQQLDFKGGDFCRSCSILIRESIAAIRSNAPVLFTSEERK